MPATSRPVRLSLILSGGASLGAYHAGVVGALVAARNRLAPSGALQIGAIGGASAGALVAVLGGWAVAASRDPMWLLREAWVERVDLDLLRGDDGRAPLSFDRLRGRFVELLDRAPTVDVSPAAVTVQVSLTGLRGLTYPVRGLRGDGSIRAATYADWFSERLEPGATVADISEPAGASLLDAALASAANPGGFAPRLLDRSADRDVYRRNGIDRIPDPLTLWFTDGGLVQSEPVGHAVAAGVHSDDTQDVAVLVDPRSENPDGAAQWSDPDHEPSWVDGLQRSLSILPAHEMYEDLRRVERDNARLRWVDRLTQTLLPHLGTPVRDELRQVLSEVAEDERSLRPSDYEPGHELPDEETLEAHLRRALAELAGVSGKVHVDADVISPLLLADDSGESSPPSLLAGEILGDFGGFLDRELRASDFDLGHACAVVWLREGLAATALSDDDVAHAVAAAEDAHDVDWQRTNLGAAGPRDLGWPARAAAARLALQLLRVTATELTGIDQLPLPRVRDRVGRVANWLLPTRR